MERISGLSVEEAKDYLLKNIETEVRHEAAIMIKDIESQAKEEADKKRLVKYYGSLSASDYDLLLLAALIYCEAGGEPYAGQLAVGAVVINRVLSSVYPNTMVGVIYQKYQFSPVGSGRLAIAMAENRATASCYKAADEAMAGQTNVGNCVYFRTPIPGLTGIQIGGHIFY